jgi:NTP pyrophosphatase (non-canonical NTP hydrolase)
MNLNLIKYIKDLTKNDKKSLIEKLGKLTEEVGELAKYILPFEGAYATNHRVVNKKKLLEECADVYLVNQSILYSLGFSDQEFEDMVFKKLEKWNILQIKEDRALTKSEVMPYEIHITVNVTDGIDIEKYKQDCKDIGVKPIILELQNLLSKKVMDDVMTSSKLYGNNGEAFDEMKRISNELKSKGYNIIREKIEASYWHPKAPFAEDQDTKMPDGCYFESHLNVKITYTDEVDKNRKLLKLGQIAKSTNSYLSKNIFKKISDNEFVVMLTYRDYKLMFEDFEGHIEFIKKNLIFSDFKLEKDVIEFAIFDTKNSHDDKWLND